MKIQIWSCCLFLGLCGELSAVTFTKRVGEDLEFQCAEGRTGYEGYVKYLCNKVCSSENVLVKTKPPKTINRKGKYTIDDRVKKPFTVIIRRLKKSDSGTYWCAVERWGILDLYYEIHLQVLDAPSSPSPPVTSKATVSPAPSFRSTRTTKPTHLSTPPLNTSRIQTSENYRPSSSSPMFSPETRRESLTVYVLYAGAVFVVIIFLVAMTLLLCRKMTKRPSASTNMVIADSTPRANNSCHANAMDTVCSQLDSAEDPGLHVTKENPIYSSREDYEATTKYSTE